MQPTSRLSRSCRRGNDLLGGSEPAYPSVSLSIYRRGMPRPRPRRARCAAPGGRPLCGGPCGISLCSFLMVSSTLRIKHAASVAAWNALTLTSAGSHTNASMLLRTPSWSKSTPAQVLPLRCSTRRRFSMSVASKPALSHSCRGMISSALANALTMACCLLGTRWSACRCR